VHHTSDEFVIDFLLKVRNEAQLVSRLVMSPRHMRAFRDAINDNLSKYEKTHGEVKR
jgi:hypothetical protein